ncbi:MAG: hypothetical protein ACYTGP_04150 [Planctomycetota bacterium]|jgi:hypothetical protein
MHRLLTTITVTTALTAPAFAGPLQKDWVAADALWVAHVDVEAITASTLGRFVLENADGLNIDMTHVDEIRNELGFDLRRDLLSVTAYGGATDVEDEAVIIAVTTGAVDDALRRLEEVGELDLQDADVDEYPVHVIVDHDERHYLHLRDGKGGRRIAVMSGDRYELLSALKVMDGRSPHMAKGNSSIFNSGPREGSMLFATIAEIDALNDIEPARQIIGLSDTVSVDVGESDGMLYAHADVSTESEEHANNIADVLTGLVALGRLAAAEHEEMAPMRDALRGVSVRPRGRRILVQVEQDVKGVMEMMKMHGMQHGKRHGHGHGDGDGDDR